MRVLLSTYGSRGDVEPMVGLAVQLRALGAEAWVCAAGLRGPCRRAAGASRPAGDWGRHRRRRTCPGARPSWSPPSSTRSPWRPRDAMRWWRPA
jgi:vancomycin aglycone glucosyltransferase